MLDNICYAPPLEKINNCETYSNRFECRVCLDGYYRKSPIECIEFEKQEVDSDCKEFSRTYFEPLCIECLDNYYHNGIKCASRKNKPEFCSTYSLTADECIKCEPTHVLNTDKNFCSLKIELCKIHTGSAKTEDLKCVQCEDEFELISKKCKSGRVNGCKIYEGIECVICKNGYYFFDGVCSVH